MKPAPAPEHLPPPAWFNRWWNPSELLVQVVGHNHQVLAHAFFAQPGLKPLREAYAAALFAKIRNISVPCEVRLERDRFPDFQLRQRGEVHNFELTEADREGRRRADEYREHEARAEQGLPPELEHFDPVQDVTNILPLIAKRISDKAGKHYRPQPHLLVYVNVLLFKDLPLTNRQAIDLAEAANGQFVSIWLLWGGNAARCFPNPAKIVLRDLPPGLF